MARLDEARALVSGMFESRNRPVDAVAGIAEDALDAPRAQPLDQEVSHRLRHVQALAPTWLREGESTWTKGGLAN